MSSSTNNLLEQGSSQIDFDPNTIFQGGHIGPGDDLFGDDLFGDGLFGGDPSGSDVLDWLNEATADAAASTLRQTQEVAADFVPSFGPLTTAPAPKHAPAPAAVQNFSPSSTLLSLPATLPRARTPTVQQDCLQSDVFLDLPAAQPNPGNANVFSNPMGNATAGNPDIMSPRPQRRVDAPRVAEMHRHGASSRAATPLMPDISSVAMNQVWAAHPPSRITDLAGFAVSTQRAGTAMPATNPTPGHAMIPRRTPMGATGIPPANNRIVPPPPPRQLNSASPRHRLPIIAGKKRVHPFVHYRPPSSVGRSSTSSTGDPLCERRKRVMKYLRIIEPADRPLGKIKQGNCPTMWYPGLGRKLTAWGPYNKFSYTGFGELDYNLRFDAKDFKEYLPKPGLQLLIQRTPTTHNYRYPGRGVSAKCRYLNCPNRNSTIEKGHLRVALVEYPELSGKVLDPFHCAGYMHLWCLESIVDVVELASDGDFFRCDDRELPYEPNEPMTLSQEYPMRKAFRVWIDAELREKQRAEYEMRTFRYCAEPYDWASRVQRRRQGASLTEAMIAAHIASKPPGSKEPTERGISMSSHFGNLNLLEETRQQKRRADRDQYEGRSQDTERGRGAGCRKEPRRDRDTRSLSPPARPHIDVASFRERNCRTVPPSHDQQDERFRQPVPPLTETETAPRIWDRRERDLALSHGLVLNTRKRTRVQDLTEKLAIDNSPRKKQDMGHRFST
ncbi:hypothetical protein RB595_009135 [Gaeumannomyces hyphopodioides]